jgi:plasmid stabilization system protein ParE
VKVYWTDTAKEHLYLIRDYISRHSEIYAKRVIDQLTRRSVQIGKFPMSGRTVPEFRIEQIREVFEGPYRIIYYIKADCIEVLAVIHGAQNVLSDDTVE